MTAAEELALIDAAIVARLTPGGITRWKEGGHEVEYGSLKELYDRKEQLEQMVAQANGIFMPVVSASEPPY